MWERGIILSCLERMTWVWYSKFLFNSWHYSPRFLLLLYLKNFLSKCRRFLLSTVHHNTNHWYLHLWGKAWKCMRSYRKRRCIAEFHTITLVVTNKTYVFKMIILKTCYYTYFGVIKISCLWFCNMLQRRWRHVLKKNNYAFFWIFLTKCHKDNSY